MSLRITDPSFSSSSTLPTAATDTTSCIYLTAGKPHCLDVLFWPLPPIYPLGKAKYPGEVEPRNHLQIQLPVLGLVIAAVLRNSQWPAKFFLFGKLQELFQIYMFKATVTSLSGILNSINNALELTGSQPPFIIHHLQLIFSILDYCSNKPEQGALAAFFG